jgi:hypothetical protein
VKWLYGLSAVPVAVWCLFVGWAVAKNLQESGSREWLAPTILYGSVAPLPWILGVGGSALLARWRRRWLWWAVAFLVALVLVLTNVISGFLA